PPWRGPPEGYHALGVCRPRSPRRVHAGSHSGAASAWTCRRRSVLPMPPYPLRTVGTTHHAAQPNHRDKKNAGLELAKQMSYASHPLEEKNRQQGERHCHVIPAAKLMRIDCLQMARVAARQHRIVDTVT